MNNDLILVLGLLIGALAFPSLVNAFSSSRPPRTAAILFVVGGGLISFAVLQQPNTYTVENVPDVFVRVIAKFMR